MLNETLRESDNFMYKTRNLQTTTEKSRKLKETDFNLQLQQLEHTWPLFMPEFEPDTVTS